MEFAQYLSQGHRLSSLLCAIARVPNVSLVLMISEPIRVNVFSFVIYYPGYQSLKIKMKGKLGRRRERRKKGHLPFLSFLFFTSDTQGSDLQKGEFAVSRTKIRRYEDLKRDRFVKAALLVQHFAFFDEAKICYAILF